MKKKSVLLILSVCILMIIVAIIIIANNVKAETPIAEGDNSEYLYWAVSESTSSAENMCEHANKHQEQRGNISYMVCDDCGVLIDSEGKEVATQNASSILNKLLIPEKDSNGNTKYILNLSDNGAALKETIGEDMFSSSIFCGMKNVPMTMTYEEGKVFPNRVTGTSAIGTRFLNKELWFAYYKTMIDTVNNSGSGGKTDFLTSLNKAVDSALECKHGKSETDDKGITTCLDCGATLINPYNNEWTEGTKVSKNLTDADIGLREFATEITNKSSFRDEIDNWLTSYEWYKAGGTYEEYTPPKYYDENEDAKKSVFDSNNPEYSNEREYYIQYPTIGFHEINESQIGFYYKQKEGTEEWERLLDIDGVVTEKYSALTISNATRQSKVLISWNSPYYGRLNRDEIKYQSRELNTSGATIGEMKNHYNTGEAYSFSFQEDTIVSKNNLQSIESIRNTNGDITLYLAGIKQGALWAERSGESLYAGTEYSNPTFSFYSDKAVYAGRVTQVYNEFTKDVAARCGKESPDVEGLLSEEYKPGIKNEKDIAVIANDEMLNNNYVLAGPIVLDYSFKKGTINKYSMTEQEDFAQMMKEILDIEIEDGQTVVNFSFGGINSAKVYAQTKDGAEVELDPKYWSFVLTNSHKDAEYKYPEPDEETFIKINNYTEFMENYLGIARIEFEFDKVYETQALYTTISGLKANVYNWTDTKDKPVYCTDSEDDGGNGSDYPHWCEANYPSGMRANLKEWTAHRTYMEAINAYYATIGDANKIAAEEKSYVKTKCTIQEPHVHYDFEGLPKNMQNHFSWQASYKRSHSGGSAITYKNLGGKVLSTGQQGDFIQLYVRDMQLYGMKLRRMGEPPSGNGEAQGYAIQCYNGMRQELEFSEMNAKAAIQLANSGIIVTNCAVKCKCKNCNCIQSETYNPTKQNVSTSVAEFDSVAFQLRNVDILTSVGVAIYYGKVTDEMGENEYYNAYFANCYKNSVSTEYDETAVHSYEDHIIGYPWYLLRDNAPAHTQNLQSVMIVLYAKRIPITHKLKVTFTIQETPPTLPVTPSKEKYLPLTMELGGYVWEDYKLRKRCKNEW